MTLKSKHNLKHFTPYVLNIHLYFQGHCELKAYLMVKKANPQPPTAYKIGSSTSISFVNNSWVCGSTVDDNKLNTDKNIFISPFIVKADLIFYVMIIMINYVCI